MKKIKNYIKWVDKILNDINYRKLLYVNAKTIIDQKRKRSYFIR